MTDHPLKEETRQKLTQVSVATLATALYKRGLRGQVAQDVHPVAPKGRNMSGSKVWWSPRPARSISPVATRRRLRNHFIGFLRLAGLRVLRVPGQAAPGGTRRPGAGRNWPSCLGFLPPGGAGEGDSGL